MPDLPDTIAVTGADTPLAVAIDAALQSREHAETTTWPAVNAGAAVVLAVALLDADTDAQRAAVLAEVTGVLEAPPPHVVVVTGSVVYGLAASNPVPLTEDTLVRPDERDPAALLLGEVERRAARLRAEREDVTVTVLRPATVVGPEVTGWRSDVVLAPSGPSRDAPPVQVVHERDVASAVVHVLASDIAGVFNVAADGWLTAEEVAALVASRTDRAAPWEVAGRAATPPASRAPSAQGALVLATTRLRATGWEPTRSNAQAVLATAEGRRARERARRKARRARLRPVVVTGVVAAAAVVLGQRHRRR